MKHQGLLLLTMTTIISGGCGDSNRPATGEVTYNCSANAAEVAVLQKEIPVFAESSGVTIVLQPFTGQEKLLSLIHI